jgi:hypothetical protein
MGEQRGASGRRAGAAKLVALLGLMSAIALAAASAPCKVVDRVKARRLTLPRQEMTLGEMREAQDEGLIRPIRFQMSVPDAMAAKVVRFPSCEMDVAAFGASIEEQTPLRLRFRHCGNGWTILWGGDCSFGMRFTVPHE